MADTTAARLDALRALVQQAKNVPMSASCMVNRAEVLALIDAARAGLDEELAKANKVAETSYDTLVRAQAEAEQIVKAAEEKAEFLAGQSEVMQRARRQAAQVEARVQAETDALRREADAYVDTRIAGFEAGLAKTMTQIKTMRARLASRSGLDAGETTTLPRVE